MVIFLKIMKNYTNFYNFSSVYIVNSNFELDFLGSARRCAQAIFFGYTTAHCSELMHVHVHLPRERLELTIPNYKIYWSTIPKR